MDSIGFKTRRVPVGIEKLRLEMRVSLIALCLVLWSTQSFAQSEPADQGAAEPEVASDSATTESETTPAEVESSTPEEQPATEVSSEEEGDSEEGEAAESTVDTVAVDEDEAEASSGETTPGTVEPVSENDPAPMVEMTEEWLRRPLVEYQTAWARGVGYLVGDRRTVVALGALRDNQRRITVRLAGDEGSSVRVREVTVATHDEDAFCILHLEEELDAEPLQISQRSLRPGDEARVIVRRTRERRERDRMFDRLRGVPDAFEVAETSITSVSPTMVTVGAADAQIWDGSPVFDANGRVLAFFGDSGFAVRAERLLDAETHVSGRRVAAPIFGFRVGTEFDGLLDDPFVVDFELGVSFWDQLGVLFRLGFALGGEVIQSIPESGDRLAGAVLGDQSAINLGLEVKYRLLLTRAAMPLYFDVVFGVVYTMSLFEAQGMAFYATDPGCDPLEEGCDVTIGPTPGRTTDHGVGAVFGFDIRAGVFTMGYRFVAEAIAHELPNTHRLTFGITYR